jgi:hypothetical protein
VHAVHIGQSAESVARFAMATLSYKEVTRFFRDTFQKVRNFLSEPILSA